jgi:hypothetical protein
MTILQISPEAPLIVHTGAAALLALHVGGGAVGIVSGWVAILANKGGRLHRRAGNVFFVAMLIMAGVGAAVAPFLSEGQWTNTTAGVFTFYLVATAWMTVRRPAGEIGRFEIAAAAVPAGIVLMALALAAVFAATPRIGGFTTVFAFSAIAAIAAASDILMIRKGGLVGPARVARHLWRMGLALTIATGSFFVGQPEYIPEPFRGTIVPVLPVFGALGLMVFWLIRTRLPRRCQAQMGAA